MTKSFQIHPNRITLFFLIVAAVSLQHSCKEDSSIIGLDIQPKGTLIEVVRDSTTNIHARTMADDSAFVKPDLPVFGKIYDSVFGNHVSEIMTEVYLEKVDTTLADTLVYFNRDSMLMTLNISGSSGDVSKVLTLNVFELREKITHLDTTYRGKLSRNNLFYPVLLAQQHFIPKTGNITLKMPTFLMDKMVENHRKLHSQTEFNNFFKGLYFAVDQSNEPSAVVSFDLAKKSYITMYFSRDSADSAIVVKYNFIFYGSTFNFPQPSFSDPIRRYLNDTAYSDTVYYIMSGNSLISRIDINGLDFLYENPKIVINKASLILPVETFNAELPFTMCEKLVLKGIDETGTEFYLPDYLVQSSTGYSYDGATYNSSKKQYEFLIPLFFQDLMEKHKTRCSFYLHPYKSSSRVQKAVLKNYGSSKAMKLIITYSII